MVNLIVRNENCGRDDAFWILHGLMVALTNRNFIHLLFYIP